MSILPKFASKWKDNDHSNIHTFLIPSSWRRSILPPLIGTCTKYFVTGPDSTLDYCTRPSKMALRAPFADKALSLHDRCLDYLVARAIGGLRGRSGNAIQWIAQWFRRWERRQRRLRWKWWRIWGWQRRWRRDSEKCLQRYVSRPRSRAWWFSPVSGCRSLESGYLRLRG